MLYKNGIRECYLELKATCGADGSPFAAIELPSSTRLAFPRLRPASLTFPSIVASNENKHTSDSVYIGS